MNLILCSENCIHQRDGYCYLEDSGRITDALDSPCCYFDEREKENNNDKDK